MATIIPSARISLLITINHLAFKKCVKCQRSTKLQSYYYTSINLSIIDNVVCICYNQYRTVVYRFPALFRKDCAMGGLLNPAIRLTIFQFNLSNRKAIPDGINEKPPEGPVRFTARKSDYVKGEQFLPPIEGVSALPIIADLSEAGQELVDAYWQPRTKDCRGYYMIRFMFAAPNHANSSEEFLKVRSGALEALSKLFSEAMWRVRGFVNPFFKDGELIDNVYSISVNFDARSPLTDRNGKPILQWEKDDDGNKIGDGPVAIKPKKFLRIINGDICVV